MKLCWCEQSGEIEDRAELVAGLKAHDIDFLRYNWRHGSKDPYANVVSNMHLSWSMGRSLLYEFSRPRRYDYFIFADDDTVFENELMSSLRVLKDSLQRYRPLTACLASDNWHNRLRRKVPKVLRPDVHPFFIADLEVQILSSFVADQTFPCVFDGGWGSLWYPNVAVGIFAPKLQLQFNGVGVRNGRTNKSGFYGGSDDKELGPKIIAGVVNELVPTWLKKSVDMYGFHRFAVFANAFLSVQGSQATDGYMERSKDTILPYFDVVRQHAIGK